VHRHDAVLFGTLLYVRVSYLYLSLAGIGRLMPAGHYISPQVAAVAHKLLADVTTARLLAALRQAGVRAIMLKGPVVAEWLYQGAVRLYGDCDILVSEEELDAAEAVLEDLGFCIVGGEPILNDRPWYARCWTRTRDGPAIDVHRTLSG
jgi:hypothetical protein